MVGELDHNFAWTGSGVAGPQLCEPDSALPRGLRGAFAGVGARPSERYRLVRDPLGLNKLFWAAHPDGSVLVAARPRGLVQAGCPFEAIHAIPPGAVLDLDFSHRTTQLRSLSLDDPSAGLSGPPPTLEATAKGIRRTLDRYLSALRTRQPDTHAFVCLSGGLDSAGVAVLTRDHFECVTAVSFDLRHPDGKASEDRITAERLARDLGLPLMCVTVSPDELLNNVDTVLMEGIDWRDFNVHAALVNCAMARAIAGTFAVGHRLPLVLTGDLMNEFLVDYHAETYRGRVFYRLPRLPPGELRAALVRGLETTHREVGPFEACGLPVVQPYAAAADQYLGLPAQLLLEPDRKQQLTRHVCGGGIPTYVFNRGKTRAQVGDPDASRGVLALCVERGLDEQWLRRRFAELHGVANPAVLDRFIRGGRYRCGVPSVGEPD